MVFPLSADIKALGVLSLSDGPPASGLGRAAPVESTVEPHCRGMQG